MHPVLSKGSWRNTQHHENLDFAHEIAFGYQSCLFSGSSIRKTTK